MKLRIFTSALLIMFLSVGSATIAKAHEGCGKESKCCSGHGWGWGHHWGCNHYIYGPDGLYAQCRDGKKGGCCDKDKEAMAEHKCGDKCGHGCAPTYRRAYYHESCCGGAYLSCEPHKSCCDKDKKNDD